MTRTLPLIVAVVGALALAVFASLPPRPLGRDAPAQAFSAARAMSDLREIARAPHPTGSAEAARARTYLVGRLQALGLETGVADFPLGEVARHQLEMMKAPVASQGTNIVAVLPGQDRTAPLVAIMAHYDSVPGSPGAADDGAGVAAVLEVARALAAGGPRRRDVVVVLTDAEELGLDGARAFFQTHPLARRVGAVVNLEARGGGGRAAMFETGDGNGEAMRLYARAVGHPSAHSLSVLVYRLMPNSTDFTLAKERGLVGFNLAFMGRASLYHSPLATADALDAGSLQHIGEQALEITRALATAPALPRPSPDRVFSDFLGLVLVGYAPAVGWLIVVAAAACLGLAAWRCRGAGVLAPREMLGGAVCALAVLLNAALILEVANLLSGAGRSAEYYDRLAALPRLEAQALALCVAVVLAALSLRPPRRWLAAAPALAAGVLAVVLGLVSVRLLGLVVLAGAAAVGARGRAGGAAAWLGAQLLLLVVVAAVQALAPTAGPLLAWPLLLAAAAIAAGVLIDPELRAPRALWPAAAATVVGGGQLLAMAHFAFLGVGADLPLAMAGPALLVAMLAWPLAPGNGRRAAVAALVLVLIGTGLALFVRLDPPAASVPTFRR